MESLLNPFKIWDSIFNSLSEGLYSNIYFRFFVIALIVGFFFLLIYILRYKHRDNIKKVLIIIVPLFAICIFVMGKLYSRGYRIEMLKQQGMEIINCLDQFKVHKGYYPEKLIELYPDCVREDYVKNEQVYRYKLNEKYSSYAFLIKEDFMGFEYLIYNPRYNNFVFTD